MVFNPSPGVAAARDFARKFKKTQVIIIHLDDMTMGFHSYGETPALCKATKKLGDIAYDAIYKHIAGDED